MLYIYAYILNEGDYLAGEEVESRSCNKEAAVELLWRSCDKVLSISFSGESIDVIKPRKVYICNLDCDICMFDKKKRYYVFSLYV